MTDALRREGRARREIRARRDFVLRESRDPPGAGGDPRAGPAARRLRAGAAGPRGVRPRPLLAVRGSGRIGRGRVGAGEPGLPLAGGAGRRDVRHGPARGGGAHPVAAPGAVSDVHHGATGAPRGTGVGLPAAQPPHDAAHARDPRQLPNSAGNSAGSGAGVPAAPHARAGAQPALRQRGGPGVVWGAAPPGGLLLRHPARRRAAGGGGDALAERRGRRRGAGQRLHAPAGPRGGAWRRSRPAPSRRRSWRASRTSCCPSSRRTCRRSGPTGGWATATRARSWRRRGSAGRAA